MSLPVIFRPIARAELHDASDWYERQKPGLGREFRDAVDALLARIIANPLRFPPLRNPIRRALLRRFPYAIHYLIEDEEIAVLAVFHTRRDPQHLEGRE